MSVVENRNHEAKVHNKNVQLYLPNRARRCQQELELEHVSGTL